MSDLATDVATTSIVSRAVAGDDIAFARIVATHRADMVRLAYVVCEDWDAAQDAAQSALLIAWRRLPSLRDPARLRPWLMSVAVNEARMIVRSRRRHPVVELDIATDASARGSTDGEIAEIDLTNALRRLDPADRALVAMRYVAGLDSPEIAAVTGKSASGVRTRLARVLSRLREELDDG